MIMAVLAMLAFTACDDFELTPEQQMAIKSGLDIVDGTDGTNGIDGLSAYEVAVKGGFEGTEEEWIISLRGEAGVDGIDGLDGLSAYQLWVLAGNEGTVDDFLASRVGQDGADGECSECETEPEPIPENFIAMTFITELTGMENIKVGHLRDGAVVELNDANISDDNGTITIEDLLEVLETGTHILGIQFDYEKIPEVDPELAPLEEVIESE